MTGHSANGRLRYVPAGRWFARRPATTIGADERRYRAMDRGRLRRHARVAVLVVPGLGLFNTLVLILFGGEGLVATVAVQGTMGLVAIAAHFLLRGHARHYPDLIVIVVATGATLASGVVGIVEPRLAVFAGCYLLLIPLAVALLIPWRPATHFAWLMLHTMVALPAILLMHGLGETDQFSLLMISVSTVGVSMLGKGLHGLEDRRSFAFRRAVVARRTELAAANRALAASLRHDPLTGARNRLRLAEDLAAARSSLGRADESWGLLTLDLDHFKAINDLFGHAAGDFVLRATVEALGDTLRPVDGIYRTGGEEFVVLLPRLAEPEIARVAERLRSTVEGLAIANPGNTPYGVATISLGAAVLDQHDLVFSDDVWMARADRALYAAKEGGRNRTALAGSGGTPTGGVVHAVPALLPLAKLT
ncbi:hypothetical protein BH24CHL6_BH24CHL6_07180 [soil metagenome]